MPHSIYVCPFNFEYVRNEGAASSDEFRDWVRSYGENFRYTLANVQKGAIFVFAWIESQGKWTLVGDGIVRNNHMTGSEKWCDCREDKDYPRHVLLGGVRLFPKNISSEDLNLRTGSFITLTPDQYLEIIEKTVSHW